jgi:LysR family transcriptional regulator, pca operon transcriptional activator
MLSKRMEQLKHRLGVKLLMHGRHGAIPIVLGNKLVNWSKIIDVEFSKILQDLDDIKGARVGHVRVGSVPPLTTRLLPSVISRMKAKHPGVLISLTEQSSRPLTESLLVGDYDLIVGGLDLDPVPPNIVDKFLFLSTTMAFVDRKHPLAKHRSVSLKNFIPIRGRAAPAWRHRVVVPARCRGPSSVRHQR